MERNKKGIQKLYLPVHKLNCSIARTVEVLNISHAAQKLATQSLHLQCCCNIAEIICAEARSNIVTFQQYYSNIAVMLQ